MPTIKCCYTVKEKKTGAKLEYKTVALGDFPYLPLPLASSE